MSQKPYLSNIQFKKFSAYGFLKNLRFFDAFLLLFFLEIGLSYSQIGILYAAREWVINIAEIPSGLIADNFGRKYSLLSAFSLYIFSFVTFFYSLNFFLILMAMLLYGLGDAFRSGTHKAMIMDYLKKQEWGMHKVEYYGHTRSWSQFGSAISAIVAGLFVLYTGNYRTVFLIAIFPYLLNFVNIATYPNYLNKRYKKIDNSEVRHSSIFNDFWSAVKKKSVFQIMHITAVHSSFLKAAKDYIQLIMLQIALLIPLLGTLESKNKSGIVIGILYFIIYLLTAWTSKNAHRFTRLNIRNLARKTLILGFFCGIVSGLMIWKEMWVLALFPFILIYVIENLRKPILTGALVDNVHGEVLTSVLSAQSFYSTLVTSTMAIILGILSDLWGVGIALSFLSFIFLLSSLLIKTLSHTTE